MMRSQILHMKLCFVPPLIYTSNKRKNMVLKASNLRAGSHAFYKEWERALVYLCYTLNTRF